ncbi:MAG: hypothetical protein P8074_07600 [Anaerolineales bacterium]|jgi:hypothetical protein
MQIERIRPTLLEMRLHPYELAALIAAARWVVEGAQGSMPPEALQQLQQVLENYDQASQEAA